MNSGKNAILESNKIFEEVPVIMKNPLLIKAQLQAVKTGQYYADMDAAEGSENISPVHSADTTLDGLDLSARSWQRGQERFCPFMARIRRLIL